MVSFDSFEDIGLLGFLCEFRVHLTLVNPYTIILFWDKFGLVCIWSTCPYVFPDLEPSGMTIEKHTPSLLNLRPKPGGEVCSVILPERLDAQFGAYLLQCLI